MKKQLLFFVSLGIAVTASIAQTPSSQKVKVAATQKAYPRSIKESRITETSINAASTGNAVTPEANPHYPASVNSSFSTTIGNTTYDLQSNGSVARRLINHGNGKLSAVWTFADDAISTSPPCVHRGTGYNFFDGTNWGTGSTSRIEGGTRTGWPAIGTLGNGKEIVLSHDPANYTMQQGTNASVGSTSWTFGVSASDSNYCAGGGGIWGRVAVSGTSKNFVHVILNSGDTASSCQLSGVKGPVVYSRSSDFGATYSPKTVTLPGYDNTLTTSGGGDNYDIDARDSVVAIVIGGWGSPVALWKSTNNGATFTRTIVDSVQKTQAPFTALFPDFDTQAAVGDTAETNDGSMSVYVDKNGVAHVAYAFSRIIRGTSAGGAPGDFINWGFETIVYWNDAQQTKVFLNSPAVTSLGDSTVGPSGSSPTSGSYLNSSLATMPSIAGDDNGHLFIVYSLPRDSDWVAPENMSYRDIFVFAFDGTNWSTTPQNLTCSMGVEEVFACAATDANTNLHIMYQQDSKPGCNVIHNTNQTVTNDINYFSVPTADILAGTAGCAVVPSGIAAKDVLEKLAVSDNYPNPFSKATSIDVYMPSQNNLLFTVTNVLGQTIMQKDLGNKSRGNHRIDIDGSQWSPGIYFYTVKAGDKSITRKMIVK